MRKPVVSIVGRPNVGKSTLFNKIIGRRKAIVEDTPGVTRDRNYEETSWNDCTFDLIDTGGFEPASKEDMLSQMRSQTQLAVEESDVIIFLCDGKEGLMPADEEAVNLLRKFQKPILPAVNKIDDPSLLIQKKIHIQIIEKPTKNNKKIYKFSQPSSPSKFNLPHLNVLYLKVFLPSQFIFLI